jgi:uncharacterized protein (TIGR03437 family)
VPMSMPISFLVKCCVILAFTWELAAQAVITTIAGTDWLFPTNPMKATSAPLGQTAGAVFDAQGNVYVADADNNVVMRISVNGNLSVVAGNGIAGFSGDGGAATNASLNKPSGLVFDAAGNLYIADTGNHSIRKIAADGTIVTIAGTGAGRDAGIPPFGPIPPFVPDGTPATKAILLSPRGLAFDGLSTIYIAEDGGIRKLDRNGAIGTLYSSSDIFNGIAFDASGDVFATTEHVLWKVSANGQASPLNIPPFLSLNGVAIDSNGLLYVCETGRNRVLVTGRQGAAFTTLAGTIAGDASTPLLNRPMGIAIDSSGSAYIAEYAHLRKVVQGGISTIAGNGLYRASGDLGPATSAVLNGPSGLALDLSGNLYIADTNNNKVRKLDTQGRITTVAGNGSAGFAGDNGPATGAQLNGPTGLALDASGNLYIADTGNGRVRKVSPQGTITTVAGKTRASDDSLGCFNVPATSIPLVYPTGVAVDSQGNLYIADYNRICRVDLSGIIHETSVDLLSAQPYSSRRITPLILDPFDNLYFGGTYGIYKVNAQATSTELVSRFFPAVGLGLDPAGNLIVETSATTAADHYYYYDLPTSTFFYSNDTSIVGRVARDGSVSVLAGGAPTGAPFGGDGGPASGATLNDPQGLAVDRSGNVYIADSRTNRIRKILAAVPTVQFSTDSLSFSGRARGALPPSQSIAIAGSIPLIALTASATDDAGGWLSISPSIGATPSTFSVTADQTSLSPGTYQGTITIQAPNANPPQKVVTVTFTVSPGINPSLGLDKASVSFTFPQQASARSQTLTVKNLGDGPLDFTVSTSISAGGNVLSVSAASGRATPSTPVVLTVTANPAGLGPGAYIGKVTVVGAGTSIDVPVTITVSAIDTAILLSQTGLTFTAVVGGGVVPPQSFAVLNIGRGIIGWSVSTSVLSNMPNWLSATPGSGSTDAALAAVPSIEVRVNPKGLGAGGYYGQVRVDAKGAANTPQVVTVFLDVRSPQNDPGPTVQPSELTFTAVAGGQSPGSKDLLVYNISPTPSSFRSSASAAGRGGLWFVNAPQDATLNLDQPTRVVVQPLTKTLAPGIYNGTITFQAGGRILNVGIKVIVVPAPSSSGVGSVTAAAGCMPTALLPGVTSLSQAFGVSAGWPVALVVDVKDDCGNALASGKVTVSFSNGDPPISMQSLKNGQWNGTWQTGNRVMSGVTLRVEAQSPAQIIGVREITGDLLSRQDPPKFDDASITSVTNDSPFVPLAPGSVISILGQRLAESQATSMDNPLPTQLAGTRVVIQGRTMPLLMVSDTQINTIVPFDVEVNTRHQLVILRGITASIPVGIDVAEAQPGILTSPQGGSNQGLIYAVRTAVDGSTQRLLVSPDMPAQAGDGLIVFCTGLGRVNVPVDAGVTPSPDDPPASTRNSVQLTIGGADVNVSFAGLAPGMVGVYMITATVPVGISTGPAVPVSVRVAGQASPQVTMALQ